MGFEPESWFPFIGGIIMLVLGGIPVLNHFGIISFQLPFLSSIGGQVFSYILAGGAVFLIIDSFLENLDEPAGVFTIIVAVILLAVGILSIVGIAIPIISAILTPIVYYILFSIEGVILIIGSFLVQ